MKKQIRTLTILLTLITTNPAHALRKTVNGEWLTEIGMLGEMFWLVWNAAIIPANFVLVTILKIKIPDSFPAQLAINAGFYTIIFLIYYFLKIFPEKKRKEAIYHALNDLNILQKTKVKKTNNNVVSYVDSFIKPKIKTTPNLITISPISNTTTQSNLESQTEFFKELFNEKNIEKIEVIQKKKLFKRYKQLQITINTIPAKFTFEEIQNQDRFSIVLGKNYKNEEVKWTPSDIPGMLVLGSMGSGKSVLINSICVQLVKKNFAKKIYLYTGKKAEEDFPNLLSHPDITVNCHQEENGYEHLKNTIKFLEKEYQNEIAQKLVQQNVKKWFELQQPQCALIIIDEAFLLSGNSNWKKETSQTFMRTISLGRARGVFGILGTQGQRAEEFKNIGIDPGRFLLTVGSQTSTPQLSQTLYGNQQLGIDAQLTKGLMLHKKGNEVQKIRTVYSDHINITNLTVECNETGIKPGRGAATGPAIEAPGGEPPLGAKEWGSQKLDSEQTTNTSSQQPSSQFPIETTSGLEFTIVSTLKKDNGWLAVTIIHKNVKRRITIKENYTPEQFLVALEKNIKKYPGGLNE